MSRAPKAPPAILPPIGESFTKAKMAEIAVVKMMTSADLFGAS